jgi:hypothetical protein
MQYRYRNESPTMLASVRDFAARGSSGEPTP